MGIDGLLDADIGLDLIVAGHKFEVSNSLQERLDMTQSHESHGERMRGGVGSGEHSDTCEWAQCEEQSCEKWRRLPPAKEISDFPTRFTCSCVVESCDVVADAYDSSDEEVISNNTL